MKTYKMFRLKNGGLYPLYVESNREIPIGVMQSASIGEKVDSTHVKASGCGGKLALRPGFHSTTIPFTDWIGKKTPEGKLIQRKNTVWCECEVPGKELTVTERYGLRDVPNGWYYFRTNTKQKDPWIISGKIKVCRILTNQEVASICKRNGIKPQEVEE